MPEASTLKKPFCTSASPALTWSAPAITVKSIVAPPSPTSTSRFFSLVPVPPASMASGLPPSVDMTMVSLPAPPAMLSAPSPPSMLSSPVPPAMLSLPSPPARLSPPLLPSRVSLPRPPTSVSPITALVPVMALFMALPVTNAAVATRCRSMPTFAAPSSSKAYFSTPVTPDSVRTWPSTVEMNCTVSKPPRSEILSPAPKSSDES